MRAAAFVALLLALLLSGCGGPATNAWALEVTQLRALRTAGATGDGIRVALLDTGIDLGHASLQHLTDGDWRDGELAGYVDFVGGPSRPTDPTGHGTFLAGVLAGREPEGLASVTHASGAVRGLAPDIELLVGRVCATDNCGLLPLAIALEWAVSEKADVISLSLGYTPDQLADQPLIADRVRQALAKAEAHGIVVVAAAGNGIAGVLFPASLPQVIAVGAMDRDGRPRATSAIEFGTEKPDLAAPGQDIVGPTTGQGRTAQDGTSAAVPFVVAAAALIMGSVADPDDAIGAARLRDALREGARPLTGQGLPHDGRSGHGLLQAQTAATLFAVAERAATPPDDRTW